MNVEYGLMPVAVLLAAVLLIAACARGLRSLSRKEGGGRGLKIVKTVVLCSVMVLAAFAGGCSAFNAIMLHHFWAQHPQPGEILDVDGHNMRIDCTGAGSPTIVLDAGLGNDAVVWNQLQPQLAKTTRVCSYDRAGFGWSDARPGTRDADHIADDLHALLAHAGVTGPIVLMGHSIAGLYIRDYANRYPQNVAGLIFIDSSTPLQDKNPALKGADAGPPAWVLRSALVLGLPRLTGMCTHDGDPLRRAKDEDTCSVRFGSIMAEANNFDRSSEEIVHAGTYGALPILIFSHDPAKALAEGQTTALDRSRQAVWSQMQANLKGLSTRSQQVIAAGTTHYLFLERPDLVERDVALFMAQLRGRAPQPAAYGSTVTE